MDFEFSESEVALVDLCDSLFSGRLADSPRSDTLADDPLWQAVTTAGLLDVAAPDASGRPGYGCVLACVVALRCGAHCVSLPVSNAIASQFALSALGLAATTEAVMPIGAGSADPIEPALDVRTTTCQITGPPILTPAGAHPILVWATIDGTTNGLVQLDSDHAGLRSEPIELCGASFVEHALDTISVTPGAVVSGAAITTVRRQCRQYDVLLSCAELCGLAEGALTMTAAYASRRQQFGRPIGTFQAVSTRLADGYIDLEAMRWTLWQAADTFARHGEAKAQIATARVWACEGADRILATAQHIHGGLGVDVEYPLHSYYLRTRQLLLSAGDAGRHLADLGAALAATDWS